MALGIKNLFVHITCFTGVFGITLHPSPTANCQRFNSLILTCSISESWVFVGFHLETAVGTENIAAFTDDGGSCKDNAVPTPGLYQTSCDYNTKTFYLTINNITDTYNGKFVECTSMPGSVKAQTTINVQFAPTSIPSITQLPNGTAIEGNKITLTCNIFGGNPLGFIDWQCLGFTIVIPTGTPPTNEHVASIERVLTRDDHGMVCECTGRHPLWATEKITNHTLNVYYRPSVTISPKYVQYEVIENTTNLVLNCTVIDANPAATSYRWYKNGYIINGSIGVSYTVQTVRRSHTGNYTCDATNYVGYSDPSSDLQLKILYGVDINPISKKEPTESTTLSVSCNTKSYPEVRNNDVIWTKKNNATFISRGQQLVINSVHRIDSGTYVCFVIIQLTPTLGQSVNVSGTTSVEVNVLYRPTVTVSPDYNQYNVIENTTNLQLTCTVTDANPAVTSYRWYKGNLLMSNIMSIYTIPALLRSHTGNYRCDATNSVGTSIPSSALQLNVLYGVDINHIGKTKPLEGTQLTITCSGQSNPVMTQRDVKWFKQNNNTFATIGLQLVIDNVNRLDSGTYVCSVALQLSPTIGQPVTVTGSTTVEVDVLYRPDVTVSPDINPYRVTENTTNVYLTCMIKDANPSVTSYAWYKNGVKISTSAIYNISTVHRSHTGSYTCDATNVVGSSDITSELHLDVHYGVSLKLSGTEVNINESQRLDLACIGDGNPLPYIIWIYNNNGTIVGAQKANVTHINVDHANCVDTGLYMCYANNSIGEPVSQSADIKVACKPRTYNNLDRVDILIRATDESINISTTFISFPLSHISWSRELSDGHLEDLDSSFKSFTIPSHLPYKTIAILQKDQLKPNEFGIYLVNASNMYGSFLMKYHFIQKRDPLLPSYVYVICKSTTAIVILKPIVNENLPQDLNIQYAVEGKDMTSVKVHMNAANQPIEYTVTGLNPGMKYNFSILAVNPFGETRSKQFECLTETFCSKEDMLEVNENSSELFNAGIASLVIGLLFFVAAAIFILRKRFKKTYTKSSKSDEYSDLQRSNPAFQDPYTSLQNPIESRHHQESIANTYEECGNASDVAAYQNIENMKSGNGIKLKCFFVIHAQNTRPYT